MMQIILFKAPWLTNNSAHWQINTKEKKLNFLISWLGGVVLYQNSKLTFIIQFDIFGHAGLPTYLDFHVKKEGLKEFDTKILRLYKLSA